MTPSEVETLVRKTISKIAPEADIDSLQPDIRIRDQIDFDSIDCLNFVEQVQNGLQIKIPEVDYPKLTTIKGCIAYLTRSFSSDQGESMCP